MFLTLNDIRIIAHDLATRIAGDFEEYQAFVAVDGGYVTSDCWDDPTDIVVESDGTVIQFR